MGVRVGLVSHAARRRRAWGLGACGHGRWKIRVPSRVALGDGGEAGIGVLIVDDHMLFAEAVLTALEANGIGVDRVANTGAEAIQAAREHPPDLALVDLGLPDRSGMSVGSEILEISPTTKVVVLTALDDDRAVRNVLRAGFHGYVTKDTPVSAFIQVIEAALAGQVVLPRRTAARVAGARSAQEDSADLLIGQLTSREREVLSLLVEGLSGQAMSNQLHISPNTVRTHVQSILTKLQVHSRLEAASFAVRHRMIASSERGWESTGA